MSKITALKPRFACLDTGLRSLKDGSWRTYGNDSSTARGYGYKWQQARIGYLAAHPLCCMCEAEDRVTLATVVDHKIPHRGDQVLFWDRTNWQGLCAHHHSSDKQRQEAAELR